MFFNLVKTRSFGVGTDCLMVPFMEQLNHADVDMQEEFINTAFHTSKMGLRSGKADL
jgi:hypothetical protein